MGTLGQYFAKDVIAMQNVNNGILPKPDNSPEAMKQREELAESMVSLRSAFGALSPDEQKQMQTCMDGMEVRAKAVEDMHQNWEKAQSAAPATIAARGRSLTKVFS